MAVKSIIDVSVNDDEFKSFAELFNKYKEQLEASKGTWEDTNAESKIAYELANRKSAVLLAQEKLQQNLAKKEKEQHDLDKERVTYWQYLVRGSREFAQNLMSAGREVLKFGAIGSVASGLLGLGGLFGFEALAGGVASGRRTSLGLNTSFGERRAFALNYGRLVEPENFLGNVQEALQDPSKRQTLYAAGLNERDLAGKDTAQVANLLLPKLKALADRTDKRFDVSVLQAYGLDRLISLQDFQRLRGTSAKDLAGYGRDYGRTSKALNLDERTQIAYQNFMVRLNTSGLRIETVLIKGLGRLADPLSRLSEAVVHTIETFSENGTFARWIDELGKGIQWLAKELGSGDFQKKVVQFVDDLGTLVKGTAGFVRWVTGFTGGAKTPAGKPAPALDTGHGIMGFLGSVKTRAGAMGFDELKPLTWPFLANDLDRHHGLPFGTLDKVFHAEGRWVPGVGWAPGPLTRFGRAKGPFQLMDINSKGIDPNNFKQSAERAAEILQRNMKEFHGDLAKALAAYNFSPAGVERDIAKHGGRWRDYLPPETKKYLDRIVGKAAVDIKITNDAGANVIISNSQVGAQR